MKILGLGGSHAWIIEHHSVAALRAWTTLIGVGLDIAGLFTGGTTTILGTILTTAGTIATGGSIGGGIIGDISGGSNSGPWSEQIPGLGGGSLSTGGTFGSGNTDPFVFSFEDGAQSGASGGSASIGAAFYGPLLWDQSGKRRAWFNGAASLFGYDQNVPLPSCFGGFVSDTLGNLSPVSPSLASLGEAGGAFYGALKFNQGLRYAATTASRTFGTSHLVYPNKSSVFRGLMKGAQNTAKVSALTSLVLAEGQAFWDEMQTMRAGRCQ